MSASENPKLAVVSLIALVLTACGAPNPTLNRVQVDMRPVDCGYKWFQTGTSPDLRRSCALPRGENIKARQTNLALEAAWKIARARCPAQCLARELHDPSVWEEPYPNGSCRDDVVHYTARVFFQCGVQ